MPVAATVTAARFPSVWGELYKKVASFLRFFLLSFYTVTVLFHSVSYSTSVKHIKAQHHQSRKKRFIHCFGLAGRLYCFISVAVVERLRQLKPS